MEFPGIKKVHVEIPGVFSRNSCEISLDYDQGVSDNFAEFLRVKACLVRVK